MPDSGAATGAITAFEMFKLTLRFAISITRCAGEHDCADWL